MKEVPLPVYRQKKRTTADATNSSQEQSTTGLPDQKHLRELARSAIRIVLEEVMSEE